MRKGSQVNKVPLWRFNEAVALFKYYYNCSSKEAQQQLKCRYDKMSYPFKDFLSGRVRNTDNNYNKMQRCIEFLKITELEEKELLIN